MLRGIVQSLAQIGRKPAEVCPVLKMGDPYREGCILLCHGLDVKGLQQAGVCADLVGIDWGGQRAGGQGRVTQSGQMAPVCIASMQARPLTTVHQGLRQRGLADAAHVEAVHVLPPVDLFGPGQGRVCASTGSQPVAGPLQNRGRQMHTSPCNPVASRPWHALVLPALKVAPPFDAPPFPEQGMLACALVLSVFDGHQVEAGLVGEDEAVRRQPLVPGPQHRIQHGFVHKEVALQWRAE